MVRLLLLVLIIGLSGCEKPRHKPFLGPSLPGTGEEGWLIEDYREPVEHKTPEEQAAWNAEHEWQYYWLHNISDQMWDNAFGPPDTI